jgi:hypothetical protein
VSAPAARPVPASRATRAALATGTGAAIACFAVALLLQALGRPEGGGSAVDLPAVLGSAIALEAWGWATLGTFAVIVAPVAAIGATGVEYARAGDRRTAWTAAGVLGVLAVSLLVSLLDR